MSRRTSPSRYRCGDWHAGDIRRKVGQIIDRVGLRGQERKLPAKLSGGQQQRVALARALVFEPGVLLLDEPFSALDKNLRELMQIEVKRLHEETGTTFVFVTHDQSEALALSTRVAIFDHGELLQIGTPRRSMSGRPTDSSPSSWARSICCRCWICGQRRRAPTGRFEESG